MTLDRALLGAALAAGVAFTARWTRSLSRGGAVAATLIGTIAAAGGWTWAILLILYFATSTLVSHWGRAAKERRTAAVVAKGGERDAMQVLANGGIFAIASLAMIARPDVRWLALGVGALAASAADTWATEIGTLFGGIPRSIISRRAIAPGMSGGVTPAGTFAAFLGAVFIAASAHLLGASNRVAAVAVVGGFAGAIVDSLLGATLQLRRWCPACARITERTIHDCGTPMQPYGGLRWLNNDAVNFICTATGGLLSAWMMR